LPIDLNFQKNREKLGKEKGVTIWGPMDPPETLGIRGSNVAVDWDLCVGCGVCIEVCPAQVYEWRETAGHPTSEKKPFPAKATKCMCCYHCEKKCPVQAIRVIFGGPQSPVDALAGFMVLVQLIGGPLYGLVFGPYLSLTLLFYVGWLVLAASLLFFFSPFLYFKTRGKPTEGKGLMNTTMIVDSGTYGIVRHPQFLGGVLAICASILISQHWLFALTGIPIVWITSKWIQEAEENLIAKFGDDYRRYMRKVPRMNLFLGILRVVKRRREN
jgi:protein-S-isoprenylcysteine O-methyltransferase Ste14/NAD-dependent dihydropyrimidine dehydrogenase PreA subunit